MAFRIRYAPSARVLTTVFVLFCAALCWPGAARAAHTSLICPAQSGNVSNGGTVAIDITACAGSLALAGLGPVDGPQQPQYGTANLRTTASNWFVDYGHAGGNQTSDVFEFSDTDGDTVQVTVTIAAPTSSIVVAPATLALTAGTAVSQPLSASGGAAPYTYALVAGTLPTGLSFSGDTISGIPSQRGSYTFTVRATDSSSATGDKTYSGTVLNPSLSLAPAAATAVQGVAFSHTLTTDGGLAPYTYALESGSLPAGLSLSGAGVISGTTGAAPGNYPVTLRVTDASTGTGTYFELEAFTVTVSAVPSVSIAVSPASVGEDDAISLVYTVTRTLNLSSPTVVNLTTTGTATNGVDYSGAVATLSIPAGATTATVTINPTADSTVEADETVILTVAAGSGYSVGAPASATGTLLNDDMPSASITVAPASVNEDSGTPLVYTVTLDQSNPAPLSIAFSVGGTATSGTDYAAVNSPLVIAAGQTMGTITVAPTTDSTVESNETVALTLAAGSGYTVGVPATASGTIVDDDQPVLTINDVSANEGDAGTASFTFTVSLSAPAGPGGVGFDIATADGSAGAGSDYTAASLAGQTIPAGSSTYSFTVLVNGDTLNEASETFSVTVGNVSGAAVGDAQGTATIVNDDAFPSLSINDATVTEGNAGTVTATLTVTLSAASAQTVSINYATANATATQPADYVAASGTLTFLPGVLTQTIVVTVNGDTTPEGDETFAVNLTAPTNATLADAQGTVTVLNDDQPVVVAPATLPAPAIGIAYSASVSASGGSGNYSYAVTAGALPAGLTFSAAGVLSGTPTAAGTFNFTVTATDTSATPGPYTGARAYTLTVGAPVLVLPVATLPGGTLAQPYTATIGPATGGTAPYTYAVTVGALPPGLSLSPTGTISGVPTTLGTFSFTVTATDSSTGTGAPYSAGAATSIIVSDGLPVAGNVSVSVAYGSPAAPVTLALSGGAASSVAVGSAPLHGTVTVTGPTTISYQPAAGFAGNDSFSYTASNGTGTSALATVTVSVGNPTITVSANAAFSAVAGTAYSQTFSWSGGAAPYSGYQVTGLPAGLSITASTADSVTVSGTPTQAGSFNLQASATDSSTGSGPFTTAQGFVLNVASPVITVSPATLPGATAGTAYQQTITASAGVAPYSYALGGTLPAGMALDPATGVLSGTPTQAGSFALTVTVTDSTTGTPASVVQNYTLQVTTPALSLTPAAGGLPATTAGSAYQVAFNAGGGVAPYSFAISTGSLPAGLVLEPTTGRLTGTPTEVGTASFSVTATDSTTGTPATVTQAYTLSVAAPVLTLTPATLPAGLFANAYQQQLSTSGGSAPYRYAVTTGALPDGLALAASGALTGTPTAAGAFAFTVTATDALGFTGTRDYTVQVTQRPDPTRDPEVRGLLSAQADAARRFASSQIVNFQQRMQRLHGASGSNGFSSNLGLAYGPQRCDPAVGSLPGSDCAAQRRQPFDREPGLDAPVAGGTADTQAPLGVWVGGSIRTGRSNGRGSAGGDFNTDGVTVGSDLRVGQDLALGVGLGYGRDRTDVGENGSRSDGKAFTLAAYGSYSPGGHLFVDALLGHQLLDYDLRRYVSSDGSFVHARRDGSQWFGSLSFGADLARGAWQFTPYARLDVARGTLDRYVERGSDVFALRYGDQDVDSSTGNAGLRMQVRRPAGWGAWTPQLQVEYQHDFSGSGTATMQYADLVGLPFYRTTLDGLDRSRWMLGAGVMFDFGRDWGLRVDYRGLVGSGDDRDQGVQISLDKQL